MLNRIIDFSINNKLIVGIFTLALVAWGIFSLRKLPIDAVPDITNNQVQVITVSPSLAAQEVERLISFPVEQAMATIPQTQEIRSISRFGLSVVTVVFHDDADIYWARQQVSERLLQARSTIPASIGLPEMAPVSTGLGEIYQYTLRATGNAKSKYDAMELRTLQDWIVRRRLLGTPGVADVSSFGGFLKQYEVAVNIDQLRSYHLSISDVFSALEKNNQNTGGSYIDKRPNAYFIRSEGLISKLADVEKVVVKHTDNGLPITIRDIATVQFGKANRYGAMTRNNEGEVVGGLVLMLKGANASKVIESVKERVAEIRKSLPEGVVIEPFLERSAFVNRAIGTVEKNLLEGALIVIFVLVLFLGNVRSGLIVASVIPLAMLFAISLMNAFGVSGNLMSLGAIDFGLIVDGAVIIVEAAMHQLLQRKGNRLSQVEMDEEVGRAARKMMNPAAFGQIIILIVYLPILALIGIEGKMFRPMAQTVSFAILGAFLLSLTYVPVVSALLLNKNLSRRRNFSDRMMDFIYRTYLPLIKGALRMKKLVVLIAVGLLVIAGFVFSRLGGEFIPTLEEGDFAVETRLLTGSSLEETINRSLKAGEILKRDFPEVREVIGKIGSGEIPTDPMPIEACDLMIILKDKSEWVSANSREALADKMAKALEAIPGVTFSFQQPIQMRFNELMTGARQDIAIKIFGEDLDMLASLAAELGKVIPTVKGAEDLYIEQVSGLPQISIRLDRDRIAQYGLNVESINDAINAGFAGGVAGTVFENERRYDLVVRLEGSERKDIEDVKRLMVTASNGLQIPLEQVANISYQLGPNQIQREDAKRRITVGFNVRGRDIASVVKEVQARIDQKVKMPAGYYLTYGGQFKNLEEANERLSVAVPAALALILLLLYFTFGSFKYSLLIFTAIPMSAIGGVFALLLRGMPFSISAGVGFIALFGVAVLNGIVLITEFNRLKKEGMEDADRIVLEGTAIRLRPVLMTAAVASLGFLPMALSTGAGAEVQKPLATVVIGGLVTATLLTLVLLPVLYVLVERGRRRKAKQPVAPATALLLFLAVSFPAKAQPPVVPNNINLQKAVGSSMTANPNIRAGSLGLEYEHALRGSVRDIGKTNINLTYGQYNSPIAYDNNITISQSFPNPVYLKRLTELADATIDASRLQLRVYQNEVAYQVKSLYYRLLYQTEQRRLSDTLIVLYANVLRAADVRFQSGETNILERYNANAQLQEAIAQKRQWEELIRTGVYQLARYTNDTTLTGIEDTVLLEKPVTLDTALLNANPELQALRAQINIAAKEIRVEKSKLLPDFSFGYFNQSLTGTYEKDGTARYYGAGKRFQGIEAGVSLSIFSKPQKARIRAAEIGQQRKEAEVEAFYFELSQRGTLLLSELRRLSIQLDYYRRTALPQAALLIRTARRAFEAGESDYYQLSQSLGNANNVRRQYIESLNQYNQAAIELELITGL